MQAVQISSDAMPVSPETSYVSNQPSGDGRVRFHSRLSTGDAAQITSGSSVVQTRYRLRTESGFGMPISPYVPDQNGRSRLRTESSFGMPNSPYIYSQWSPPSLPTQIAGSTAPIAGQGVTYTAMQPAVMPQQAVMPSTTVQGMGPMTTPTATMTAVQPIQLSNLLQTQGCYPGMYQQQPMMLPGQMNMPQAQPQQTVMAYQQGPAAKPPLTAPPAQQAPQFAPPPAPRHAPAPPAPKQSAAGAKQVVVNTLDVPKTTVMLRNLPPGFTREKLMSLLDDEGFAGSYDFAYLPFDFETLAPLNHAFVNFSKASEADRCHEHFEGFTRWPVPSDTVCGVAWNDRQQGLPALIERYKNSPVMHDSVPEACKPVIISGGQRAPFPAPTQKIKAPKILKGKNV